MITIHLQDIVLDAFEKVTIDVGSDHGIHCRNAAELIKIAARYDGRIYFANGDNLADAGSLMGVLTLEAYKGTILDVYFEYKIDEQIHAELQRAVNTDY
ncbi:HPr family phosphocarrier protein [Candidatus Woesearchaeota archaeon]|nr:HPr family phosphocarrier protein [Candidatus Woesearchaeota archaeon]